MNHTSVSSKIDGITESNKKVLVVDESEILDTFSVYADLINRDFDTADNFVQAKKMIETGAYDILITDSHLRGRSGLDLVKQAKDVGLRVVIMSGDDRVKVKADEEDVSFLPKPFTLESFSKLLRRVLPKTESLVLLLDEASGRLTRSEIKQQIAQLMDYLKKQSNKMTALRNWLETKDFVRGDVDSLGDEYKKNWDKDKSYPDWDEAVYFTFNDSAIQSVSSDNVDKLNEKIDLDSAKKEIENIKNKLNELKHRILKEKELGKPEEFLKKLSQQWACLQEKIVNIWRKYDAEHGTRYARAYESAASKKFNKI